MRKSRVLNNLNDGDYTGAIDAALMETGMDELVGEDVVIDIDSAEISFDDADNKGRLTIEFKVVPDIEGEGDSDASTGANEEVEDDEDTGGEGRL